MKARGHGGTEKLRNGDAGMTDGGHGGTMTVKRGEGGMVTTTHGIGGTEMP